MGKQKTSSWEFKLQMVHLLEKGTHNMFQVSRDYHVTRSRLYAWIRLYQQRGEAAFIPDRAIDSPPEVERPHTAEEQVAQLERLCGQQALELDLLRSEVDNILALAKNQRRSHILHRNALHKFLLITAVEGLFVRSAFNRTEIRRHRKVKVLVTGAAGFVGGHLVDMLVERGDEVRALVQPGGDTSHLRALTGIEIIHGDLIDAASLRSAVQGVQRVYNVAAKTGPWGLERVYQAANVQGLANLIHAAMDAGVLRIVHTSSITVYGHHLHSIVTEDYPYHAENNPYSRTKIAGEKLISKLVKEYRAPIVVVRPAWVYGPRDSASFSRFVNLVGSGKGFMIGSGKNIVPVVYVRDVAQGLIKAGDAGNEAVGRAYNIADDRRVTQAEYLNTIADTLHVSHVSRKLPFSVAYLAGRAAEGIWQAMGRRKGAAPPLTTYGVTLLGGDQQFSIERARRELGYAPEFDVKRGVAEGVRWYLNRVKTQA